MDVIYSHLHMEHSPNMPPQLPYIPTWEELWAPKIFGAGTSGAHGDEDNE